MKVNIAKVGYLATFILFFALFLQSYAAEIGNHNNTIGNNNSNSIIGNNNNNNGTIGNNPVSLTNPLGDTTLMGFLQELLDVLMVFAIPLIVFMIIYAGFLFVMDRGSDKNLAQAKRALLYAVIGGVIIIGANIILDVIQGTVDAFR